MPAVLLIEDDQRIRQTLSGQLTGAGHAVRSEATGAAGLAAVVDWEPDVIILDLGLPDIDGAQVLRMIRGISSVPVIIATARDDEDEAVRLLDAGADDHVVKPYSGQAIEARVRAVLRRAARSGGDDRDGPVVVGGLVIRPAERRAQLDGEELGLTRLEYDLLAHLAMRSPEVVTRRELLAAVWHQPHGGSEKTVDVHLSWLRRKMGETAAAPRYLHTVRGVGVRIQPPE